MVEHDDAVVIFELKFVLSVLLFCCAEVCLLACFYCLIVCWLVGWFRFDMPLSGCGGFRARWSLPLT